MNIRNSKHLSNLLLIFTATMGLVFCNIVTRDFEKPFIFISKQNSSVNLDKKFLNYFHLGQKRLISALFWVSTILESDVEHYKGKDLNSWMFLRFETISLLDPNFLETYSFGGPYLSIIKDDIEGASQIYKKGIAIYPQNYQLLKNAAFHFHFEAENYIESYKVLNLLKKIPNINPSVLSSLARIESSKGNLESAFTLLLDIYNQLKEKNNPLAEKIFNDLYSIKAEQDLNCLNSLSSECKKTDLLGQSYIKRADGKYYAVKQWLPYKIKKRKRSTDEDKK